MGTSAQKERTAPTTAGAAEREPTARAAAVAVAIILKEGVGPGDARAVLTRRKDKGA